MMDVDLKKCGVRFSPPALVITYLQRSTGKLHRRTMPLRNFTKRSSVNNAIEDLKSNPRHYKFLKDFSQSQLLRLVTIIKDKLGGLSLEASVAKNNELDTVKPDEDLNKVDQETLMRKKAVMEESFEKNRKRPGDSDFQYDIEVEFGEKLETCEWDSDGSDPDF